MKTCPACNIPKELSEFRPNKTKKDGLQGYCKLCDKEKQTEWYQNNSTKCKEKALARNRSNRLENRNYVIEYLKSHPCINCGEADIVVLEFDHIRDKKCGVAQLISTSTLKLLKEEIKKCQVLCANCHALKTRNAGVAKLANTH